MRNYFLEFSRIFSTDFKFFYLSFKTTIWELRVISVSIQSQDSAIHPFGISSTFFRKTNQKKNLTINIFNPPLFNIILPKTECSYADCFD